MANQLLIRSYNVGCGDCIYVRIPGPNDGFHILIDCGTKGEAALLKKAISHLKANGLPAGSKAGTHRLDLIVATHRHEDHIKGFDPTVFENIQVKNIWLSVAMDPKHPQATGVNSLHAYATTAMRTLSASGLALSPEVDMLASMYGVSNDVADDLLMKKLPAANKIQPRYMHSGMKHGLKLPKGTDIDILAPEKDVDHFYLGEEIDTTLKGLRGIADTLAPRRVASRKTATVPQPTNISASDFRILQSRMLSNGLAFAAKESSIQNNLSVVLLITWKKRRLLFVGDAEWEGEFKAGKHNGSWNVMWELHRKTLSKAPIDFLKIGHHGSINATPPPLSEKTKKAKEDGIYTVLDTILPVPKGGKKPTALAIASTEREFYNPIPECKLLVDLARRVKNTRDYGAVLKKHGVDPKKIWISDKAKKHKFFDTFEKAFLDTPQPVRTDLEFAAEKRDFVDIEIPPG